MIRVLHIINGMGTGGAEKDIMNWYRNINTDQIQFDFLIRSDEDFYKDEILKRGGKFYKVPSFPKRFIRNFRETKKYLKTHSDYVAIHVHGNALIYIYPLIVAKKYGISKRIFHAHNTQAKSALSGLIHKLHKLVIDRYANVLIACSKEAGIFSYGNRKFITVNNAMDLAKYSEPLEKDKYDELDIENKYVVGHVGRFLPVKNQRFVVDVFSEIKKKRTDSVLLLIGEGYMRGEVERHVAELGLSDSVKFLGERNDVEKIIPLMDILVFPSLYEGVPLVVLEAQASRTKIVYSNIIDDQVKISPYVRPVPLQASKEEWAKSALAFSEEDIDCDIDDCFESKGYTINQVVKQLSEIYLKGN